MKHVLTCPVSALILLMAAGALAQERQERIRFAPGATAATVTGSVTGYNDKQYVLGARTGQILSIDFRPSKSVLYYNVLKDGELLRDGSIESNDKWSKALPKDGDYVIDVYLMRAEARYGTKATFKLTASIMGG
jgi:hypothetical protein